MEPWLPGCSKPTRLPVPAQLLHAPACCCLLQVPANSEFDIRVTDPVRQGEGVAVSERRGSAAEGQGPGRVGGWTEKLWEQLCLHTQDWELSCLSMLLAPASSPACARLLQSGFQGCCCQFQRLTEYCGCLPCEPSSTPPRTTPPCLSAPPHTPPHPLPRPTCRTRC